MVWMLYYIIFYHLYNFICYGSDAFFEFQKHVLLCYVPLYGRAPCCIIFCTSLYCRDAYENICMLILL